MREIRKEFKSDGFDFQQVAREGMVAIYEKTKRGFTKSSFEVVKIGMSREREAFGVKFEAGENYPPNETWGERGWTMVDKDRAFEKMRELVGGVV